MQRIGIIGAGPSGLAALKALREAGLEAHAWEAGERVGGVWSLEARDTAAYDSLHLITSRGRTEYAGFPMPEGTPDYPSRDAVGRWLEDYVERFGLGDHLRLGARIESARRRDEGGWDVSDQHGTSEHVDALVVANGHNGEPKLPDPPYPGEFAGEQLHAMQYRSPEQLRGRRVLVVGMGNSAMDIVTDASLVGARALLSVRHGSWVIPKRLLGKPADQVVKPWVAVHVPWRLRQPVAQTLLRIAAGRPETYGLPAPTRGLFQDHPTITDTVLSRIAHGELHPKGPIASLDGELVRFADGSSEPVDVIVWCTGYRVALPFLDGALAGDDPQELPLYKHVLHPGADDLFFIGFMQSTGSALPIVERQAQLLAGHLTGRWKPPSPRAMRADQARRRKRALARWGDHGRPGMRVDFDAYMHELGVELRRGARRARRNGGPPL